MKPEDVVTRGNARDLIAEMDRKDCEKREERLKALERENVREEMRSDFSIAVEMYTSMMKGLGIQKSNDVKDHIAELFQGIRKARANMVRHMVSLVGEK